MLHKSHFGHHADNMPADLDGHIPEDGDSWRKMNYDHGPRNPHEEGISDKEQAERMEYLDKEWWPKIIAIASQQRSQIELSSADTPIKHWEEIMHQHPSLPHGFEVEGHDES
jgi:hypothetical protein